MDTNTELVNKWLIHQQRERGRSTKTLYTYSKDAESLLRSLGSLTFREVTADDLRDWVYAPLGQGPRKGDLPAPATLKRRLAAARSLFGFLHAEGLLPKNVSQRVFTPAVRNEKPKPVERDDWVRLWKSDLSDADRVAFGLGTFCGLRRSEIVSVTPENLDGNMLVGFPRKGGKQGAIPIESCLGFFEANDPDMIGGSAATFIEPWQRLITAREPHLPIVPYDTPLRRARTNMPTVDPQTVNRRLKRALRQAGMDEETFSPHQLRHTFCTFLVQCGVPLLSVSRLAAHATVTVTERYVKTDMDPLADLLPTGSTVNKYPRI